VGYTVPEEYFALIKMVRERVPNSDKARFSAHCHDDLGMAVANSLAGVQAGIRQIECTINASAERAGNASLEELVMAMKVRNDVLAVLDQRRQHAAHPRSEAGRGQPPRFRCSTTRRSSAATRSRTNPAFTMDGMLKHTQTYEIMRPESGGREADLAGVMGKHPGRHAFVHKLEEMGYRLAGNQLEDAFRALSRRSPTARSTSTTRTSRRWSTRRSRTRRTA